MSSRNPVVPTLEVVSASLPSRLVELTATETTIGRDPTSHVWLNLNRISWNHARVVRNPDGTFYVEDLKSSNQTFLNESLLTPFVHYPMADCGYIRMCDVTLIFRTQAVRMDGEAGEGMTILGTIDDMSSLSLAARTERAAEVLRAVLEINRQLGGAAELNVVLGRALRQLFQIYTQAECGFIVTREADGKLVPRATLHRSGRDEQLTLSRTVMNHVLSKGKAILITDANSDSRFQSAGSLSGTGIRTAMCVPISGSSGAPIGVIQIDTRVHKASFGPADLELLAAVAVPIGVVVENHTMLSDRALLSAAAEVQAALLPKRQPTVKGYAFWERYQPALVVGGDYYDYIAVDADRRGEAPEDPQIWAVAVGDVAGKGMPAALLMANLSAEVRHLVRAGYPPEEVVARANDHVCLAELPGRFVTFVLVTVDTRTHRLTIVNAGHMAPLVRRAGGGAEPIGLETDSGMPLGLECGVKYRTTSTTLGPGDVVVLYTDGVSDAQSPKDRYFQTEGITRAVAAAGPSPEAVGGSLLRALRLHLDVRPQNDDIAIVCFGRV